MKKQINSLLCCSSIVFLLSCVLFLPAQKNNDLNHWNQNSSGKERRKKQNLSHKGHSKQTQQAVNRALSWLAEHQAPDGHWDAFHYPRQCDERHCTRLVNKDHVQNNNVSVTGLALLAFFGAGYTPSSDKKLENYHVGTTIQKGLKWLRNKQKPSGAFTTNGTKYMYNNAIASQAYAEAYEMTKNELFRPVAQKAIDYLLSVQNKNKGWGYFGNRSHNDTSVTGWSAMALYIASRAGLDVPERGLQGALNWIRNATGNRGHVGYSDRFRDVSKTIGKKISQRGNRNFKGHPTRAGIGMIIRMISNRNLKNKDVFRKGAGLLSNDLPTWKTGANLDTRDSPIDFYYWYYGSLALYHFAGPESPRGEKKYWENWNNALQQALLPHQKKNGPEKGSWDPVGRWAYLGGRIYATALNALTLEVYYRYHNFLSTK